MPKSTEKNGGNKGRRRFLKNVTLGAGAFALTANSEYGALKPKHTHGISDNEVTPAQLVKTKGYATGIFGKWHLGHHPQFLPTHHGYGEYCGLPYSNDMWPGNPDYPGQFPPLLASLEPAWQAFARAISVTTSVETKARY
jgi:arylsulfatase A-like enzyme